MREKSVLPKSIMSENPSSCRVARDFRFDDDVRESSHIVVKKFVFV